MPALERSIMARQSTKRKDKDRIVLRKGEWQRPNGSYDYRWTDQFGKRHVIYGKTLEELREKEKEVDRDISDGIKAEKRNTTVNELFDLWCHISVGLRIIPSKTTSICITPLFDLSLGNLKYLK